MKKHFLLGEVALLVSTDEVTVRPHQIAYALANRLVPEPALRIGGKRVFLAEDIERLRAYFHRSTITARKREV